VSGSENKNGRRRRTNHLTHSFLRARGKGTRGGCEGKARGALGLKKKKALRSGYTKILEANDREEYMEEKTYLRENGRAEKKVYN